MLSIIPERRYVWASASVSSSSWPQMSPALSSSNKQKINIGQIPSLSWSVWLSMTRCFYSVGSDWRTSSTVWVRCLPLIWYWRPRWVRGWLVKVIGERMYYCWRHHKHHGTSNHQPFNYLFNSLFKRTTDETWKLCIAGPLCGTPLLLTDSPHKWPVLGKTYPSHGMIWGGKSERWVVREVGSGKMYLKLLLSVQNFE